MMVHVLVLLFGAAMAQDVEDSELLTEPDSSDLLPGSPPKLVVLGFEDDPDSGDCDAVLSRYGRCVERVKFFDGGLRRSPVVRADVVQSAVLANTGDLYAELWEDLSFRWANDDVLTATLQDAGVSRLLAPGEQWHTTPRAADARVFALPVADGWLDSTDWIGEYESASRPIFASVRFLHPVGTWSPPPVSVMRGRFAARLAFDGKRHAYDLMDGDPEISGPFFEQMFPYATALAQTQSLDMSRDQGGDTEAAGGTIPLTDFIADDRLKNPGDRGAQALADLRRERYAKLLLAQGAGAAGLRDAASKQFDQFYRNVGVQIVRFAREEYTPTHLRVLTALIAMESPPGTIKASGIAKDVVAASAGQTDSEEMLLAEMGSGGGFSRGMEFELDYRELPITIVDKYLKTFSEWTEADPDFVQAYEDRLFKEFEDILRDNAPPLRSLDDVALKDWSERAALPGRSLALQGQLKRSALGLLVSNWPPLAEGEQRANEELHHKDHVETNILLDHVSLDIVSNFVADEGALATPAELQGIASSEWKSVLSSHGIFTAAIPDGPGAVDPLAICTTLDRREALAEPSFGAVNLDLLVSASADASSGDEVLWEARYQVPFIMLDDPAHFSQELENYEVKRLVLLPDGQAIYRIRYRIWSGWHMFWSPEIVDPKTQQERLALRTGAVCGDMVLASPELVPTLVRAALLEGDLRPVMPVKGNGKRALEKYRSENDPGKFRRLQEKVGQVATAKRAIGAMGGVKANPSAVVADVTNLDLTRGSRDSLSKKSRNRDPGIPTIQTDTVAYLRDLVFTPLREKAGEGSVLVSVFDHGHPTKRSKVWSYRPHTPYARKRHRAGRGEFVHSSAWTYYVPGAKDDEVEVISPAYQPTESVATQTLAPKWRRRKTGAWTTTAGIGQYPLRSARYGCPGTQAVLAEPSTVAPCDPDYTTTARTDGFSIDMAAMRTVWFLDRPRWAVEFGPEVRVDVLHGGTPWYWKSDTSYSTAFRYTFGMDVGLRHMPSPGPLAVRRSSAYPWGAEAADGSARLTRLEYGLRFAGLIGPVYNGMEGSLASELWLGWSMRKSRTAASTFTPYKPNFLLGPFVRGMVSKVIARSADAERYYDLREALSLHVGIRGHLRVGGKGNLPETK